MIASRIPSRLTVGGARRRELPSPAVPLPAGFRFGVATSGFQIEGGYNGPGEPSNNWLDWERAGRVPPAGVALDFWNRYEEVLDRAVAAGCDAFRLSIEWARCEPSPGCLDGAAFDRYRAILAACQERGIEPVVCLLHFSHPHWLGPDFWLDLRSPDRFAVWVAAAVDRLEGAGCRHWLTINEINALAFQAYFTQALPPGRLGRTGDTVRAIGNLLAGHVLAYRAIHHVQPDAVVATNNHALSVYELDRLLLDVLLARGHGIEREDLAEWLSDRRRDFHAALPVPGPLERLQRIVAASILPLHKAVPRAVSEVFAGPDRRLLDVVQVNYYDPVTAHRVSLPGRRTVGGRTRTPFRRVWDDAVHPEGLPLYLRANHEPGLDLWVAENGLCNRVLHDGRVFPRLDGWDRVRYLRANLAAVARAIDEGLPVTRYFHWTLADNYEWGSYEPRFGLYRVDQVGGDAGGPRWSDVDAFGGASAGTYRRLATAMRKGEARPVSP
ncbi:MAG: family 1 glycosylhydrolase [Actinomycetota bacterium]|nr:family 1 glycosylhydrolase [Actinomycetota bacterium]